VLLVVVFGGGLYFFEFAKTTFEQEVYNTQTVPLLRSPMSTEVVAAVGGAVINFVEGESILPIVGPLGSVADVDDYRLDQITTYTIREGDNLSAIAEMFGISTRTLYWANDIKQGDLIRTGDVLVILPISGLQYEIEEGDTIEKIAKDNKGNVAEILSFNNLSEGIPLIVGSTVVIPNAELSPIPPPTPRTYTRGTGGPDLGNYFTRPISGGRKSQGLHGFNGVDLASSCGASVYASASGRVLISRSFGWNGGYGKYIVMAHPNGTQTVYSHLSSVSVLVGDYVSKGAIIGAVGSTGNSTGCHIHFEVRGAKNTF
jgi:murein DD-endopeptidase MepM/ murein hydrolase activator NlpD